MKGFLCQCATHNPNHIQTSLTECATVCWPWSGCSSKLSKCNAENWISFFLTASIISFTASKIVLAKASLLFKEEKRQQMKQQSCGNGQWKRMSMHTRAWKRRENDHWQKGREESQLVSIITKVP